MRPKTLIATGVALGCGLIAAVMTAQFLNTQKEMQVLVAQKPIARGTPLTDYESLFVLSKIPPNVQLPTNCVTSLDQLKDKSKDHLVKQAMNPGEPLSMNNVIDKKEAGLVYTLQPGLTALAVRATPESSFAGLLEPGNHVKVISLKKVPGGEKRTVILMKNVRVLAVDTNLAKNPEKGTAIPSIITLEVNDEEAKKLRLAQEDGPLALGLMSHGNNEDRKGEEEPDRNTDPLREKIAVLVAQKPMPRGSAIKEPQSLFVLKEVPKILLPGNYITRFEDIADKAQDHLLVKPLLADEPLSADYLFKSGADKVLPPPESYLTILEGPNQRIYARNSAGRMTLVETITAPK